MSGRSFSIIAVLVFTFSIKALTQNNNCNFLCNTDFDDQSIAVANGNGYVTQSFITCWKTTAGDTIFEVWGTGFQGVPSYSGIQFIEINANVPATLYQDFTASLGSTVQISFAHRGRLGTDELSVEIGPIGGPYTNLGNFLAGNTAWVYNTVPFTFPTSGTTNYTVRFNSVSSVGGGGLGNFLDAISITLPKPVVSLNSINPTCPLKANGAITASVSSGSSPFTYNWLTPLSSTDSFVNSLSQGTYTVQVTDFYGCKDTQSVILTNQSLEPVVNINVSLCPGDVYTRPNGAVVTQAGIYTDTVLSVFCDTIRVQNISFNTAYNDTILQSICAGDSFNFNGNTYRQSGYYPAIYATINGCDSIITLALTVNPAYNDTFSQSICTGDSFNFNGNTYRQSGYYPAVYSNIDGCDSIRTLALTVNPAYNDTFSQTICAGDSFNFNGNTYRQSGYYPAIYATINGCDSVRTLALNVNPTLNATVSNSICIGQLYTLPDGSTVDTPGIYITNLQNVFGCDSIVTTNLNVITVATIIADIVACNSYTLNGVTYTSSIDVRDTVRNSQGCITNITINSILIDANKYDTIATCINPGESYFTGGGNQTNGGVYYDTVPALNQGFCPTLRSTFLELIIPKVDTLPTINAVDKILINGTVYTENIVIENLALSQYGCDSLLQLQPVVINKTPEGKLLMPNVFSPNGDNSNDIIEPLYNSSITILSFKIFNRWGEMVYNGQKGWDGYYNGTLQKPDVYVYTLSAIDKSGNKSIYIHGSLTMIM